MSRILLVDDSPHAQRMGERILQEEGYQVSTIPDGMAALTRLAEIDPDVVIADVFVPRKSGYEICQFIKSHQQYRHIRVILTSGMLEAFDEAEAHTVGSDAVLKKPFEATPMLALVARLAKDAQADRTLTPPPAPPELSHPAEPAHTCSVTPEISEVIVPELVVSEPILPPEHIEPSVQEPLLAPVVVHEQPSPELEALPHSEPVILLPPIEDAAELSLAPVSIPPPLPEPDQPQIEPHTHTPDPERVRAAVTVALDAAMPALIEELTQKVLIALGK